MAEIATGNADDALDVLQDAMYKLVQKYAERPADEWGPLFHTILQSKIKDYHRRNVVRNRYRVWFSRRDDEDKQDPIQTAADEAAVNPEDAVDMTESMEVLEQAVRSLPRRQQQAFMLRALEGLNVQETANVMKCSTGSVKTHYFRALSSLKEKLSDYE
jgi:RNA polymerase sigma-70 factor (ECF subfamily)